MRKYRLYPRRTEEAVKVLQEMHHHYDKHLGLRWVDLTSYIEEYALGRKLNKVELKRFVEKKILTINRQARKRR